MGIQTLTTIAYSKEENAIVERANKEVMRHLRALLFELNDYKDWDTYLPMVQRIMNTSIHSVLRVSPHTLVFGENTNADNEAIFVPTEHNSPQPMWEGVANMLLVQRRLLNKAMTLQKKKDENHVLHNTRTMKQTEFPINSYVLVEYPDSRMGHKPPTKFHTQLKGPYQVIACVTWSGEYTIRNLVTNKDERVHASRLRPFNFDAHRTDPLQVALRDRNEFIVEKVLDHSGQPSRKSQMDFLVKWEGYDDSENLWLPWHELVSNSRLHEYLRDKGMSRLIPASYLTNINTLYSVFETGKRGLNNSKVHKWSLINNIWVTN
jgi:hypothetical protein